MQPGQCMLKPNHPHELRTGNCISFPARYRCPPPLPCHPNLWHMVSWVRPTPCASNALVRSLTSSVISTECTRPAATSACLQGRGGRQHGTCGMTLRHAAPVQATTVPAACGPKHACCCSMHEPRSTCWWGCRRWARAAPHTPQSQTAPARTGLRSMDIRCSASAVTNRPSPHWPAQRGS